MRANHYAHVIRRLLPMSYAFIVGLREACLSLIAICRATPERAADAHYASRRCPAII